MSDGDSRVFGLDLLRALAVLFVVYAHGYFLIANNVSGTLYNLAVFDGVTMFFVLSGFLIGRILLRTVAKDEFNWQMLAEFWVRRWFRTLPNYFAVLTFLIIAFYLLGRPQPEHLLRYFFFSQNIASPHPEFFPELWSLTIEEWFYLCIPIPLYLSTKLRNFDRRRLMLFWIASVIVLVTGFRIYRAYRFGYATVDDWDVALRKQVLTRLDSLMFGVFGAYLSLYHQRLWRDIAGLALLVGVSLLLFDKVMHSTSSKMFYLNYINLTLTAVATLLLLPMLSSWKRHSGRLAGIVTFVSLTSYSMYLLNLSPVQMVILPFVMRTVSQFCWRCSQSPLLGYILYWVVTVTGSFLLYRYFERPMTALREKWHFRGKAVETAFSVPTSEEVRAKPGARA